MERRLHIEQLDQERLIKNNDLQEVTNPVMFNAGNGPTPDGLLSNEIFGITKAERSGIYGWIDLGEKFINPYYYKIWLKLDKNLRSCVYETQNFIIKDGYLVPSDEGQTGLKFLVKNIDSIKFKQTKKDAFLKALNDAKKKNKLFTSKFVIIPPYFRDVETTSSGRVGVGEINKLYINLLNNRRALSESNDYGLSIAGGMRGKIQDTMLEIYNWFTLGESVIGGEHTGAGIFKKFGIIRRSVMSKTTDYATRLVLSAPNINAERKEDLIVNMDYSGLPLSACCVLMYPFMIYYLRQFFTNEFGGQIYYSYIDSKDGSVKRVQLDNPQINFSDDRFDKEINEFVHGYSYRFKPVEIPNKEGKKIRLRFKGYNVSDEDYAAGKYSDTNMIDRDITWMDILYISAVEASQDKTVIISRYPIDSHFNQLYTKFHVLSTIKTEPMVINGKFYQWYPKVRQEDIGSDTSNKFIDTCQIANPYCKGMGADYDGDQITARVPFSVEANQELKQHINSNGQFIAMDGINSRGAQNEAIQAMYDLTLVLPNTKITDPIF